MTNPRGVTIRVDADPARDEPASVVADVVGYAIVTAPGRLYVRHVDSVDAVLLAAGLREAAHQLEHYAEHGTWPPPLGTP